VEKSQKKAVLANYYIFLYVYTYNGEEVL